MSSNFAGTSAVEITAQIRILQDQAATKAAADAAKEAIVSAFEGIQIPIGPQILESVKTSSPDISSAIAAAMTEGGSAGAAAIKEQMAATSAQMAEQIAASVEMGFAGGGLTSAYTSAAGGIPPVFAQPGELIRDNANFYASKFATQDAADLAEKEAAASDLAALQAGAAMEAARYPWGGGVVAEEGAAETAGVGGMGMLGGIFGLYMIRRGFVAEEEQFQQTARDEERLGTAEEIPVGTATQRLSRARDILAARRTMTNDAGGFMAGVNDVFGGMTGVERAELSNPLTAPAALLTGGIRGMRQFYQGWDTAQENQDQAQTDVNMAKRETDEETKKRLELENQITEAMLKGNKIMAEHLRLLEQFGEVEDKMNANAPGSGTAWFNANAPQLFQGQATEAAAQSDVERDVAAEARQDPQIEAQIMHMEASGDKRGAAKFAFQEGLVKRQQKALNEQTIAKAAEIAASPTYAAIARAGNDPFSPGAMKELQSEADAEANAGNIGPATKLLQAHQQEQAVYAAAASENADYDALHRDSGVRFESPMENLRRSANAAQFTGTPHPFMGLGQHISGGGGFGGYGGGAGIGGGAGDAWGTGLAHGYAAGGMITHGIPAGFGGAGPSHGFGIGSGMHSTHPLGGASVAGNIGALGHSAAAAAAGAAAAHAAHISASLQTQGGAHAHDPGYIQRMQAADAQDHLTRMEQLKHKSDDSLLHRDLIMHKYGGSPIDRGFLETQEDKDNAELDSMGITDPTRRNQFSRGRAAAGAATGWGPTQQNALLMLQREQHNFGISTPTQLNAMYGAEHPGGSPMSSAAGGMPQAATALLAAATKLDNAKFLHAVVV